MLLAINSIRPKITRSRLARELVKLRLPVHLRGISNCSGTLGKKKIDQALLKAVEGRCFSNFPLIDGETHAAAWQLCKDTINEWCRRINHYEKNQ